MRHFDQAALFLESCLECGLVDNTEETGIVNIFIIIVLDSSILKALWFRLCFWNMPDTLRAWALLEEWDIIASWQDKMDCYSYSSTFHHNGV